MVNNPIKLIVLYQINIFLMDFGLKICLDNLDMYFTLRSKIIWEHEVFKKSSKTKIHMGKDSWKIMEFNVENDENIIFLQMILIKIKVSKS